MEQHKHEIQTKPHDTFFKEILVLPGAGAALLKERLAPELVARLRLDTVEPAPGDYIDCESDVLLRAKTVEGEDVLVYVLIEHKSAPEKWVALQLLRYLSRIYERWHTAHPRKDLPLVVPMVVYHGEDPWNAPATFGGLLAGRKPATPMHLDFGIELVNVGKIPDEALSEHPLLSRSMYLLKYGPRTRARVTVVELVVVLRFIREENREFFARAFRYTVNVSPAEHEAEIFEEVRRVIPEEEVVYRTVADELRDQGRNEGLREGEARGEARGSRHANIRTLKRQLTHRFGPLPARAEQRIDQADEPQLDAWLDRILDAKTVDDVLADS